MPLSPQITITPEDITFKSFTISAVSYTSTTATYTATGHTLSTGDIVQITGLAPDGYNGTYTITGTATNTFTVANTTNTALTDQAGNVYWADATEYEYDGGQGVAYIPNNNDVDSIINANAALQAAAAAAALAQTDATSAIALAGTKNTVFYSGTAPTAIAIDDLWIDTANGNLLKTWNGTAWVGVQDTAIAAAAAAATAAQTTADGKNKVYRQGTSPGTTGNTVGDIWFNTSSDNAISRWDGSSWVATSLGTNALANFSANKITSGTIDASVVTVSNINAGNISTGTLSADRIAAGSITGSKLVANTITASQIATGTITATQIATGTITATQISSSYVYAGTIAASQITAGTLSGFTIQSTNAAFVISSTGSISGADTIGCNSLTASGTVSGATLSATSTVSTVNLNLTGNVTSDLNLNSGQELRVPYAYSTTTANAATVWISSTGQLRRSTASSQRYKENITAITDVPDLDPKLLLQIPVKAFTYKEGYLPETSDRAGQMLPGFIAEDVDAIYPIAADYDNGNVETWNDRFIVPGLLALVQDLYKEIETLKGN